MMFTRLRAVLPPWRGREEEPPLAARDAQYDEYWQQLSAVVAEKDALHVRIDQVDGSLTELAQQLRLLVQREAAICDQLAEFWASDDDICAAYLGWNWAAHLRK